jgi:D-sedoheptulose 7-phosphate isomerase
VTARPGTVEALYPFLYGGDDDRSGSRAGALTASATAKLQESAALRRAALEQHAETLARCAMAVHRSLACAGAVFVLGNGGSSTDADALARAIRQTRPAHAVALTSETAVLTALANDIGFEHAVARHLAALVRAGDVVVAISTSGSSPNLVRALEVARQRHAVTVALSGTGGGRFVELDVDYGFVVPSSSVHRVQEAHTAIYEVLVQLVGHLYERGAAHGPEERRVHDARPSGR